MKPVYSSQVKPSALGFMPKIPNIPGAQMARGCEVLSSQLPICATSSANARSFRFWLVKVEGKGLPKCGVGDFFLEVKIEFDEAVKLNASLYSNPE
jgi:hypothetical protein